MLPGEVEIKRIHRGLPTEGRELIPGSRWEQFSQQPKWLNAHENAKLCPADPFRLHYLDHLDGAQAFVDRLNESWNGEVLAENRGVHRPFDCGVLAGRRGIVDLDFDAVLAKR